MAGQLPWTFDFPLRVAIPFVAWLFCCGACIGSFLNVVIYRLPRGRSLSHPSSCCPSCDHPIRWHDNIPILSWIRLGARCRDCNSPIAIRYLLVEGIVASSFVLLGMTEPITGGSGLPQRYSVQELDIWMVFVAHLVLTSTLLAAGLICWDRGRVPARLFAVMLAVLLVALLVAADFYPLPAWEGSSRWISLLTGLTAGCLAGTILAGCEKVLAGKSSRTVVAALAIAGMTLGWQLAAALLVLVIGTYLPLQLAVGRRRPLPILLVVAAATMPLIAHWGWWWKFIS